MWDIIFPILVLGGSLYGLTRLRVVSLERLRTWQDAATSCGLQVVETSSQFEARGESLRVRIEDSREVNQWSRIVVEAPASPDLVHVTIRPDSTLHFDRDIEVGDQHFDSTFLIGGPVRLMFAWLDAEVRRLLLAESHKSRLEVSRGELQAVVPDERIAEVLPLVLDISKRFPSPMDVPRRLAENANQDPEPGVRRKNLLLLIRELPNHPETAEALRKACSDPIPDIRLRAAKEVGAEGRGTLLELAENLEDDAMSAEAVSALDRDLPFERARAILDQALSLHRIQTARACLGVLGRSGAAAAVDALAKVSALENIELATAAAQALGATGSPTAEPSLIMALQREQMDLQVAAANALARVGSAAAVPPLKDANERSWLDLKLRRATRQAIAEIQSRLQGASPGQLSLAGAEVGQLSLAQADAGQLSLAADPAGQLSLPSEEPGQLSLPEQE